MVYPPHIYNDDGKSNKQKPAQKSKEKAKPPLYDQNPAGPPENI